MLFATTVAVAALRPKLRHRSRTKSEVLIPYPRIDVVSTTFVTVRYLVCVQVGLC